MKEILGPCGKCVFQDRYSGVCMRLAYGGRCRYKEGLECGVDCYYCRSCPQWQEFVNIVSFGGKVYHA